MEIPEGEKLEDTPSAAQGLNSVIMPFVKSHIAVLDRYGTIGAVSVPWSRFAPQHEVQSPAPVDVGINYLKVCRQAAKAVDSIAHRALEGIEAVLDGPCYDFRLEYPCHALSTVRWFDGRVHYRVI